MTGRLMENTLTPVSVLRAPWELRYQASSVSSYHGVLLTTYFNRSDKLITHLQANKMNHKILCVDSPHQSIYGWQVAIANVDQHSERLVPYRTMLWLRHRLNDPLCQLFHETRQVWFLPAYFNAIGYFLQGNRIPKVNLIQI